MKLPIQLEKITSIRRLYTTAAMLFLCTVYVTAQDGSAAAGDPIVLSPFEVNSTGDGDYYVSDTLAGNRLRTNMKDIGAALTQVSKDLMDDLGALDMTDVANFLPSVDATTTQDDGPEDVNGAWRPQRYRIRGLFTETTSRNYFVNTSADSPLTSDSYNMERAEVSAGANSILFGAANPAGIINYSTLRHVFGRDFSKITYRTDNYGTNRVEVHTNQSIRKDNLGFRIAYLNEAEEGWPEPRWKDQERIYIASKWKISDRTTIHANYEWADAERSIPYWGNYRNRYGAWEDAGSPLIPWSATSNPSGAGINNYSGAALQNMVFGSVNGASVYLENWQRKPVSRQKNVTVANLALQPTPPELTEGRQLVSNLRINDQQGWFADIAVEHKFTDDLQMQLAAYGSNHRMDVYTSFDASKLVRDAAATLPDGSVNPNAGGYFIDAGINQIRDNKYENRNLRWTASYNLDLRDTSKWLGRHQIALMAEAREGVRYTNRGQLFNTGPARPVTGNYLAGANKLRTIIYVDPSRGYEGRGPIPDIRTMPQVYSSFEGITAEWKNFQPGTHDEQQQNSYLIASHSHFMDDRLVVTAGYRIDQQDFRSVTAATWEKEPVTGFFLPWDKNTAPLVKVDDASGISEGTYSVGAVYHLIENKGAVDYFSLSYNKSTNFAPTQGFPTFFGGTSGSSTGETEDFGVKLGMFRGKLNSTLNFFEGGQFGARASGAGTMVGAWNQVWNSLEEITGDTSLLNNLLPDQSSNSDTDDYVAKGVEINLTYSPKPNWRVSFFASKNETERSNILPATRRFIAENWGALRATYGSTMLPNGITVNERLDTAENSLATIYAQEGTQPLNQREWKFSLITNYRFTEKLRGLSVGGNLIWQDEAIIGYYRNAQNEPVPDDPIFGDTMLNLGLNLRYRTEILNGKVEWTTQLNIRNVLDDTDVYPIRAEASQSAREVYVWGYQYQQPRSFFVTTSFGF